MLCLKLNVLFRCIVRVPVKFCGIPVMMTFLTTVLITYLRGETLSFSGGLRVVTRKIKSGGVVAVLLVFLTTKSFMKIIKEDDTRDITCYVLDLVPTEFSISILFVITYFISITVKASIKAVALLAPVTMTISATSKFSLTFYITSIVKKTVFKSGLSFVSSAAVTTYGNRKYRVGSGFERGF